MHNMASHDGPLVQLARVSEQVRQRAAIGPPVAASSTRPVLPSSHATESLRTVAPDASTYPGEGASPSDSSEDSVSDAGGMRTSHRRLDNARQGPGGAHRGPPLQRARDFAVDINVTRGQEYTALDSAGEEGDDIWQDSDEEYFVDPFYSYGDDSGDDSDVDINDDDALWEATRNKEEIESWQTTGWDAAPVHNTRETEYPRLFDDIWGPTPEVAEHAENPMWLYFYFFPKNLFHIMAAESNRYALSNLGARVQEIHAWQKKSAARDNVSKDFIETPDQIHARLASSFERFTAEEYAKLFGLFIARTLWPNLGLDRHWNPVPSGALPAGTFHKIMPKSRFDALVKYWHFADNEDPRAKTDRVWKVRPLIDALQDSFKRGYRPGPFLSFDEGSLSPPPSMWMQRSRFKIQQIKSDTKLFVACCSASAYCLRFEVYCGKKFVGDKRVVDTVAGPIAVARNVDLVLPARRSQFHVVTMDKRFTSVPLLRELLSRNVYALGEVQQRRVGLPVQLLDEEKRRPQGTPRGPCAAARSRAEPSLVACRWWDSRPVFVLGTGASLEVQSIERRSAIGEETEQVPCPKIVLDYKKHKRGAEVFHNMRHSDLSLQRMFRFKKSYKRIAMGLLDCALVNAYIVHKRTYEGKEKKPMSHVEFMSILHEQLLQVQPGDLATVIEESMPHLTIQTPTSSAPSHHVNGHRQEGTPDLSSSLTRDRNNQQTDPVSVLQLTSAMADRPPGAPRKVKPGLSKWDGRMSIQIVASREIPPPATPPTPRPFNAAEHFPAETQDFIEGTNGQGRKRMARGCKVCSYMAPKGSRGLNTKFYCPGCSVDHSVDVYLCNLVRHVSRGARKTCFQIWHDDWLCGKELPEGDKRLHFRPPTGKKRRRHPEEQHGRDQVGVESGGLSTSS